MLQLDRRGLSESELSYEKTIFQNGCVATGKCYGQSHGLVVSSVGLVMFWSCQVLVVSCVGRAMCWSCQVLVMSVEMLQLPKLITHSTD